jgi:uncharacterized protein (TIGR02265 family)
MEELLQRENEKGVDSPEKIPVIKGIFVRSHINALRKEKGEQGVKLLEKKFGRSVKFKNSDDVPVKDEIKILELVYEILYGEGIDEKQRAFEAGRLHFKNFTSTPLARIIFPMFRKRFKTILLRSNNIASHVFRGIKFYSQDIGENAVKVTMCNADYPIEHFKGLLSEWMHFSGIEGEISATALSGSTYEYIMQWRKKR